MSTSDDSNIDLQGVMILLHGPPKVGKTQLCSKFPNPVQFIATETGHRFIEERQKKIMVELPPEKDSWPKFKRYCKSLGANSKKRKPKTVVIDTIAGLYQLCFDWVCAKNGWEHPSDANHGKGWDAVKREFYEGMNSLAWATHSIEATLILVAHSREDEIETRTGKRYKVVVDLQGTPRRLIMPVPDHVWFLGYSETKDPKASVHNFQHDRALFLGGSDVLEAGCRDTRITHLVVSPLSIEEPYQQILETISK